MKNRILGYLSLVMAFGLILSACETDIQKANEAYDFSAIKPVVLGMTGPTSVSQTFSQKYYVTYYRAGSTWNWSTTDNASIDSTAGDGGHDCYVNFPNDGTVMIFVTETTEGGLTSEPDTLSVTVNPFCPMTRDDMLGTWTGTEGEDGSGDGFSVTFVAGAGANELTIEAAAGIPGLLGNVYEGWGESFQAGFGEEGNITMTVNVDGSLVFPWTYWGQTLPGPYDYWYWGSGNWDGCGAAPTMTFDFSMDYWGDSSDPGTAYLSSVSISKQ